MSDLKEKIANLKINTRSADSKRIEELLEDYELRADEGDYTPNESEKLLMMDFAIGLLDRSSSETENSPPGIEIGKYRLTPMSSRSIRIELIGGGEGGEFSVSELERRIQNLYQEEMQKSMFSEGE